MPAAWWALSNGCVRSTGGRSTSNRSWLVGVASGCVRLMLVTSHQCASFPSSKWSESEVQAGFEVEVEVRLAPRQRRERHAARARDVERELLGVLAAQRLEQDVVACLA